MNNLPEVNRVISAPDIERLHDLLDKACLICGLANRFHRVFYSPKNGHYIRQAIDDCWLPAPLVPSTDHYACITNLEYLEYEATKKNL